MPICPNGHVLPEDDDPGAGRWWTLQRVEQCLACGLPVGPQFDDQERNISDELARLTEVITDFHERSRESDELIRKLRARIEVLEAEQTLLNSKPLVRKLARMHAGLAYPKAKPDSGVYWDSDDLANGVLAMEDVLDEMDVKSIEAKIGDHYDASKHNAKDVVITDDPNLDKTINRVITQGFTYINSPRVLFPADVVIAKYEPSHGHSTPAEVPTD